MAEEIVLSPVDKLTPEERKAYKLYIQKGDPPLAPGVQAQLYMLYLNGSSCEEIVKLNPNFTLGMVARAKVEGLWDDRRDTHLQNLFENVRERVQQVQMESVMFSADLLSSANKMFGDKLKRYIQTGDERELGTLRIDSLKQYRDAVELLLKLTGQDKKVEVSGQVKQTVEFTGPMSPKDAAALLKSANIKES
jgi:hypothetical protein